MEQNKLYTALADSLLRAYDTHTQIPILTLEHPELTAADGYAIQNINRAVALERGQEIRGMKIGLSAKELMLSMGVNEPDYGILYSGAEIESNGSVDFADLFQPKVEGEIAFVMGKDVPENATADTILECTDYICAAYELPQTRTADWQNKIADTVADNSSAGHFMLSENRVSPRDVNFMTIGLTLWKNGEVIGQGQSDVVMGNPLNSVAWLSNKLRQHGMVLKKGYAVLSGALCGAHLAAQGDTFKAEFGQLGTLLLHFN
jgi:2-keto-4-pentenoate hydratase